VPKMKPIINRVSSITQDRWDTDAFSFIPIKNYDKIQFFGNWVAYEDSESPSIEDLLP